MKWNLWLSYENEVVALQWIAGSALFYDYIPLYTNSSNSNGEAANAVKNQFFKALLCWFFAANKTSPDQRAKHGNNTY